MASQGIITLVFMSCMAPNSALLFHGDGTQVQATTLGPLGKDATLSLLVQEVMDLKAKVKSQDQEIQTLRNFHTYSNDLAGLQAITRRLDNMTLSIQQLTLYQQVHEMQYKQNNLTIYRELDHLSDNVQDLMLKEGLQKQHTGIRLVGGSDPNNGRVEVFYYGQWYTVCDDQFDVKDAMVVCRMLGKNTTNAVAYTNAHFGQGSVPILLSDLGCTGTEKDLFYCYFKPLGTVDCAHYEDAGVICG